MPAFSKRNLNGGLLLSSPSVKKKNMTKANKVVAAQNSTLVKPVFILSGFFILYNNCAMLIHLM